ncbi:Crp/Fnr family transcriptional regulator [Magnetococcus marinus]|nr:cyclic nucleotide-binding domain-containing protein [Magnetococcus marinus]
MSFQIIYEKLSGIELFKLLPESARMQIAEFCEIIRVEPGQRLIEQHTETDDQNRDLLIVLKGSTDVDAMLSNHQDARNLDLHPINTDLYGEISWLLNIPRTARVTCTELSLVLKIRGAELHTWCSQNPEGGIILMRGIAKILAKRVDNLTRQMSNKEVWDFRK